MNRLHEFLENQASKELFSGNVLIVQNDEIIFQNSYGLSSHQLNVKNNLDTKFQVASITKTITATAILLLADQKKLKLEDRLTHYIPDYPNGDQITIYQLLTHTAGVTEVLQLENVESFKYKTHTIEEAINRFKYQPLDFKPGLKFNYSNSGYTLLAYIIEKLTNKTYEQFITDEIFKPLNMTKTGVLNEEKIITNMASGYSKDENELTNCKLACNSTIINGAGNLYSTVHDLFKFVKTLKNGTLLSKELYQKWNNVFEHAEDNFYSGFGCIIHKPKEVELIYQDGGISGFKSVYMIYPKKDQIIIFLSNFDFIKVAEVADEIEKRIEGNNVNR